MLLTVVYMSALTPECNLYGWTQFTSSPTKLLIHLQYTYIGIRSPHFARNHYSCGLRKP